MGSTPISIVIPYGSSNSTCGYCSPPGERTAQRSSSKASSFEAEQLSCAVYQAMIDRGWRRSGTYCYKPDLRASCCPQYTIKLAACEYKPSRSYKKVVNRWNEFVLRGCEGGGDVHMKPVKRKGALNAPFSLVDAIHAADRNLVKDLQPAHNFEVTLVPSDYTDEKFQLYKRYQEAIHNDFGSTPYRFRGFLVDSPLIKTPIKYPSPPPKHLPAEYGSHHQMYRLDGELIAMGVIDVLPKCVSCVYFLYDPAWQKYSFGKLSAMHEASLVREIHGAGVEDMMWLYMGFYIHSCQKMRYKGEYSPSYLLDPEQYTWFPFEECVPLLDKYRYACFSDITHSLEETSVDMRASPQPVSEDVLREMRLYCYDSQGDLTIEPLFGTTAWSNLALRQHLSVYASGLGPELTKEIIVKF